MVFHEGIQKAYLILWVCCFTLPATFSQTYSFKINQGSPYANTGQLGLTIGPTFYTGELNSGNFSFSRSTSLALSFYGQYHISNVFGLRVQLLGGFLNGGSRTIVLDESIIEESFSGAFLEGTFNGILNFSNLISQYKPTRKFFFYGLLGIGYGGWYSSMMNKIYDFDSLEFDNPLQNFNAATLLPIGLGFQYRIGSRISLGMEYTARFYFSDMLDNTVGLYRNDIIHYLSFGIALNLGTGKRQPQLPRRPSPLLPDPYIQPTPCDPPPVMNPPPPQVQPVETYDYVVQVFAFAQHKYTAEWIEKRYRIPVPVRLERDGNVRRYLVGNCDNMLCADKLRDQMIQAGIRGMPLS